MAILTNPANFPRMVILTNFAIERLSLNGGTDDSAILTNPANSARIAILTIFAIERLSSNGVPTMRRF